MEVYTYRGGEKLFLSKADDDGYAPSTARFAHRVDPDNPEQKFYATFYGVNSKLFGSTRRFTLAAPPTGNDYILALKEVRGLGISAALAGSLPSGFDKRTPDQTTIGIFWGYDGAKGLGTPPRFYNQIVRQVATENGYTEERNALLFMLVNVALGDAGILAWEQKYFHNFWRPVVGIREHDPSMGWETAGNDTLDENCDPAWLPLGGPATNASNQQFNTAQTAATFPFNQITTTKAKNFMPNFPAYPSGHATFGAAALHMTRIFYGIPADDVMPDNKLQQLSFVSEEMNGVNQDNNGTVRPRHKRKFKDGLWQMIEENGRSRVYLGVHWIFDAFALGSDGKPDLNQNIGGVKLGLDIAKNIYSLFYKTTTTSKQKRSG